MSRLGAVIAVCLIACGDEPICPSDLFVALQTSQISVDTDTITPGVQADIRVRTSLAEGEEVTLDVDGAILTTTVDATGLATFEDVTVNTPATRIRASVSVFCGDASDELLIPVTVGPSCSLSFTPTPLANAFYAPALVFNASTGNTPTAIVTTIPGSSIELFQNAGSGEQSLGIFDAGDDGIAEIPTTIADGSHSFRAFCTRGDTAAVSSPISLVVDTTPPTCAFIEPPPGTTITPSFDNNLNLADGIQLLVTAQVTGDDTIDETTTLTVGATAVSSTKIDIDGKAGGLATIAATPGAVAFEFTARDHAQNTCTLSETYNVVLDGCDLVVTSPVATVTTDASAAAGSQLDVELQVSQACAGRTVTSDCGDNPSGVVAADGSLTLQPTLCTTSPCETSELCTFSVSTADGVITNTSAQLGFDDLGPTTTVAIVSPAIACGSVITPASDADPNTDGVQVIARVTSAGTNTLRVTNGGTTTLNAASDVTLTLAPGTTSLVGVGADAFGNLGLSATCTVSLADLTVSFAAPAADGIVNRADGTVAGDSLGFALCGSVNKAGASVELSIDGGAPQAATVTGTTWCRTVSLSESPPSHTITATALAGSSSGATSLVLQVDITAPPAVDNFNAIALDRRSLEMTFDAPSEVPASYVVKVSTTLLDDSNFDTTGIALAAPAPAAPGTQQTLTFTPAFLQFGYFFAIATVDDAGNRSVAQLAGPVSPILDRTGGLASPNVTQGSLRLGTAVAYGRFNDDDIDDLAVSAPTQNAGPNANAGAVYIYFGSALGIGLVPDATITSTAANGRFGAGLAAVRWSSSTRDDLAIGAPGLATHGQIAIFRTIASGSRDASTADATITASTTSPGAFASGSLGSCLVTADIDGEGTPDLVASLPTGAANNGGIVVLYGDTFPTSGNVVLSEVDASSANGAISELFVDPLSAGRRLGTYLHSVGPTLGALDATEDLALAYSDDATTTERMFILRSDGARPSIAGVTPRVFKPDRDVRIDYVTSFTTAEFGAQATTIDDRDGDGARDLVVSAHAHNGGRGQVLVISGSVMGTGGVALTTDPGVTLTTINGGSSSRLGALVLARSEIHSELDGDGVDDLIVVGRQGAFVRGFVWYGNALLSGTTTVATASASVAAPAEFRIGFVMRPGSQGVMQWVGDLDDDGLEDICWASPITTGDDGAFEVFD